MRKVIDASEVKSYQEQGFTVIERNTTHENLYMPPDGERYWTTLFELTYLVVIPDEEQPT